MKETLKEARIIFEAGSAHYVDDIADSRDALGVANKSGAVRVADDADAARVAALAGAPQGSRR